MAIKNLLVTYSGSASSDAALDFALFMRNKYDAHLTGLLAHNFAPINPNVSSWIPEELRESIKKARVKASKAIENQFKERIANNPAADKIHWISKRGESDTTVAKYARLYDLTIIGRYDAVHGEGQVELHPDMIAMISGRPVLLIPREFDMASFTEHAVLAWDGKRASSRALADAMQILETKSLVTIVTVDDGDAGLVLPGIDAGTALQRHGIKTEQVVLKRGDKSVGKRILKFLEQMQPQPGLLVMGAYEHSKFRQSIVGGVTSSVLKKAKVPIIISH
ncbi:MAG: universal stress protein [Gammaproteobacteria bacterium]|nr:universal stress protein [Gammaproteobacteria bacterium]MCP5416846.1 universal stress protein [Chromatiaceae bacterium]